MSNSFSKWMEETHPCSCGPKLGDTGPVPLRAGEKHCVYCGGYGEHARRPGEHGVPGKRRRCEACGGSGKQKA